jgi:hypothetical protein
MLKTKPDKLYLDGFGVYIGREEGCLVVRDRERGHTGTHVRTSTRSREQVHMFGFGVKF